MKKGEIILLALALAFLPLATANSAPIINLEQTNFLACEGAQFSTQFQITDDTTQSLNIDLSPRNPFFIRSLENSTAELFSLNLTKDQANKAHEVTIAVQDSEFIDTKKVSIKVIETNNPPELETLKVQTISLDRTTTFSRQFEAQDLESQALTFNSNFLSGEKLFDVSSSGLVEATLDSTKAGVYEIEICAQDLGLTNLDNQAEFCNENGEKKFTCNSFQLTVASTNSQPTILESSPEKTEIKTTEGEEIIFNIQTFDPENTLPDIYWYVDTELKEFQSGLSDKKIFSTLFDCSSEGLHTVMVEITDGLLNDSLIWTVTVDEDGTCEPKKKQTQCEEKWACETWVDCQNALQSHEFGSLPREDFLKISEECTALGIATEICGFQIRTCEDANYCDTTENTPTQIKACRFLSNPSCSDEIRNCHDGSCEFKADCGGSCDSCLTCSDGIKNQGEEGTDCGGPCTAVCPTKNTLARQKAMKYGAIILIAALLIFALFKLIQIIRIKVKLSSMSKNNKGFNNKMVSRLK